MPAHVYQPLHWWTERDFHLLHWPIMLVSDDMMPALCGRLGLTVYTDSVIYVWAGQSKSDLLDTALHEVIHACLSKSDLRYEEHAISTIAPRILPTLMRRGWAPPPLPRGWQSLAAHARWIRFGSLQRDPDNE